MIDIKYVAKEKYSPASIYLLYKSLLGPFAAKKVYSMLPEGYINDSEIRDNLKKARLFLIEHGASSSKPDFVKSVCNDTELFRASIDKNLKKTMANKYVFYEHCVNPKNLELFYDMPGSSSKDSFKDLENQLIRTYTTKFLTNNDPDLAKFIMSRVEPRTIFDIISEIGQVPPEVYSFLDNNIPKIPLYWMQTYLKETASLEILRIAIPRVYRNRVYQKILQELPVDSVRYFVESHDPMSLREIHTLFQSRPSQEERQILVSAGLWHDSLVPEEYIQFLDERHTIYFELRPDIRRLIKKRSDFAGNLLSCPITDISFIILS